MSLLLLLRPQSGGGGGGGGNTIAVPAGSLVLTGYAPTVINPKTIAVPAGSLALTGYAPAVSVSQIIAVPAGSLVLTGYAPTVVNPKTIGVPAGSLTLTGYAPTVLNAVVVSIPAGALTLTAYAPTVDVSTDNVPARIVSDGTFIWNWLYGKKRRVAEELDEEVAEAAQAVLEEAKAQDDAALALALDNLESALAEAVKRNKALVERAMYAQLIRSIEDQIERLRALQIQRLEAHLAERAAYRAMVDAEAVELLSILELIE